MATEDKLLNGSGLAHLTGKIKDAIDDKSEVSVSSTGTATDEVGYITIDGVEKKIAGGGGSSLQNILDGSATGSVRTVGTSTTISQYAFAEGRNTKASGMNSHAEGSSTTASGTYSHAEGDTTRASGQNSHAEGFVTTASGKYSHAEGWRTGAISDYQHVQGKANVQDARSVFADIVGNGTGENAHSNASALDWDGNLYISGKVYQDCTDYSTNSSGLVTPGCGGTPVGGGTPSNMVTTDTAQTITGKKVFNQTITTPAVINNDGINLIATGIRTIVVGQTNHTLNLQGKSNLQFNSQNVAMESQIPTVVANPATTTDTLTGITIGNTSYAIPSGSGAVAIDNKTITKNANDELETVIGGKYIAQQVAGDKVCDVNSYYSSSGTETNITYTILQKLLQLDEQNLLKFLYISSGTTYIVPVTIDRSTSGTYVIDVIKNNLTTYRFTWTGDSSSWTCSYQCVGNFDYLSFGTKYFVEMEEQLVPSPIKDGRFIPIDTSTLEVDTNNNISTKLIKAGNGIIINKDPSTVTCGNYAIAIDASVVGNSSIAIGDSASGQECINIGTINNYNHANRSSSVIGSQNNCQGREYINIFGTFNNTSTNAEYKTIIGNGSEYDNGNQFAYIVGISRATNSRKTGQTIDANGNHYICGDVYANCTDYSTTSSGLTTAGCGGKKLATEEYVDTRIPAPPSSDGEYNLHCSIVNGTPTYTWKAE